MLSRLLRDLGDIRTSLEDTIEQLAVRGLLLERLSNSTQDLQTSTEMMVHRAQTLEVRRQCTLCMVAAVLLTVVFLGLMISSYLVNV